MASWEQFEKEAPELAAKVKARFLANKHHILATLRQDGSPRVSGNEIQFEGEEIYAGMMDNARKVFDLRRDPRFALHSNPGAETMEGGDARIGGTAIEEGSVDGHPGSHNFRLSIDQVVLVSLHPKGDRLVIETWSPGRPVRRKERF